MVKTPIHPSARRVDTTVKQKRVGEINVLLDSAGKYSMHHARFIVPV